METLATKATVVVEAEPKKQEVSAPKTVISNNSQIISPKDTICLHTSDDKFFFVRLNRTTKQHFKRNGQPVELKPIIGQNYNTFWEVEKPSLKLIGPLDYNPLPQQKLEDTEDDISGDNKDIADNGKSQQLTDLEINELKTQLHGRELIKKITENSLSFSKRTSLSKEKYMAKKKKKYLLFFKVLQPSPMNILAAYYKKSPERIGWLRLDSMNEMLALANVYAGSKVLVFDTMMGVFLSSIVHRNSYYQTKIEVKPKKIENSAASASTDTEKPKETQEFESEIKKTFVPCGKIIRLYAKDQISSNLLALKLQNLPTEVETERVFLPDSFLNAFMQKISSESTDSSKIETPFISHIPLAVLNGLSTQGNAFFDHILKIQKDKFNNRIPHADPKPQNPEKQSQNNKKNKKNKKMEIEDDEEIAPQEEEDQEMQAKPQDLEFKNETPEERQARFLKEREQRYLSQSKLFANTLLNPKADSLVIATMDYDIELIFRTCFPFLCSSGHFAIFSPFCEPLQKLYIQLRSNKMQDNATVADLSFTETYLREYQVLPHRTHPHMKTSGGSGYVLSGIKITQQQ